ncbi:ABC transporter permease [Microbacterium sp. A196]|uniref:ABC transporter permease n=1 Tax=unclassified Microbacterium TaxID=2609290 RepID=UPI003F3F85CB
MTATKAEALRRAPADGRADRRPIVTRGALRFLGTKFGRMLLVFIATTLLVFSLTSLVPGDPALALAGDDADPATVALIRAELGLDRPWIVQYLSWFGGLFVGDLGTSFTLRAPVGALILDRLPATMSIALTAIAIAVIAGVLVGMLAAAYRGRMADRVTTVLSTLGIVTPNFWVGMILILLFAFAIPIFPAVGYTAFEDDPVDWFAHIILPAIALAMAVGAELQRQTRSSISDTLTQDYIRTARSQGLSRSRVLWTRALKNGSLPVVTVIGYQMAGLLGGSVVVEKVFNIPGLGTLAINSVVAKDIPVLQGIVLVTTVIVIVVNFLTDVLYTVLNPKVRVS